jgi:hypothetical protein
VLIFILYRLEENSQLTLLELVNQCQENFQIETSEDAVRRALEKMQITWKNVLPIPESWNAREVIDARSWFVGSILPAIEMKNRATIYIDESGFNMHVKRSKGRALKGELAREFILDLVHNSVLLMDNAKFIMPTSLRISGR